MKSLCRRAGVPHYGFHCIRHYVATLLHDSLKIPTGVIGNLLGHQSKRTTEIYLHSVDESARIAMDRLEEFAKEFAKPSCKLAVSGTHGNADEQ
jgi:integrase